MHKKINNRSIFIFLPLLLLYIVLTIVFSKNNFVQDEQRYIEYATNLTNGFYTSTTEVKLTNGPGYPLILYPFVLFKTPLIYPKLLNSLFLFWAVIIFYYTLTQFLSKKMSILLSYSIGLYPPILRYLLLVQPEIFTYFLFCVFLYFLFKYKTLNLKSIVALSTVLALIILTRVLFGWVSLVGLLFYTILYFVKKENQYKSFSFVFLVSLLFCLPYLVYTYTLTGKIFYWSTNAGDVLYWMSTPYEGEYGDYPNDGRLWKLRTGPESPHYPVFLKLRKLSSEYERDNLEMEEAKKNIRNYPLKYIKNCGLNISRLIFNYPYSLDYQNPKTLAYTIPNSILLFLFLITLYPLFKLKNKISKNIYFIIFIYLTYLGGSSLVSGVGRYILVIIPFIAFHLIYIYKQNFEFKLKT